MNEAGGYYKDQAKAAVDEVTAAVGRAKDAFQSAWNKRGGSQP